MFFLQQVSSCIFISPLFFFLNCTSIIFFYDLGAIHNVLYTPSSWSFFSGSSTQCSDLSSMVTNSAFELVNVNVTTVSQGEMDMYLFTLCNYMHVHFTFNHNFYIY